MPVMGSGVLVIESSWNMLKNVLTPTEIVGYGSNCDAYHMTTPTPDGSGAAKGLNWRTNEAESNLRMPIMSTHMVPLLHRLMKRKARLFLFWKEVPVSSNKHLQDTC